MVSLTDRRWGAREADLDSRLQAPPDTYRPRNSSGKIRRVEVSHARNGGTT
jgi:hypothetical protein